ncbi:MAG: NADH-quinone oxidoreductase subunit D [Gammaproteobacteria bacterium]|nr:NADH-quinone oxidoreductase subunit D [Gammaproteobacteria bacterium]
MAQIKHYTINFGPQHPAAHGVLRLILELDGETIEHADPHIGLLHRATEKLAETKPYNQTIGYMDRMDYIALMINEHAYVMAIEKLLGISVPIRAQYIRVMFDELSRILNHLFWIGANSLDVGAMSILLYAYREREEIIDCYEAVSGSRMHATYYRPGGVYRDLPQTMPKYRASPWVSKKELDRLNQHRGGSLLDFIDSFVDAFPAKLAEYETLLTDNRIFKQRTVDISPIATEEALAFGLTGPMLRATGMAWDVRKKQPYEVYDQLDFAIPVGKTGDCYDRYLVRVEEMKQSTHLVKQCVSWLRDNPGPVMISDQKVAPPPRDKMKKGMEDLIHHFKLFTEGYCTPVGEVYTAVESPKGELGMYIISDGANKPYRLKVRGPCFPHMAAMDKLSRGHMLADAVAILGSLDLVFGEVDR